MKKIATLVGAAALLAATFGPAIAAGNSCTNSTTGPFSNNTCSVTNTSTVTVNNVNDAQIVNNVRTNSNTGNNSASYNTLGGSIVTGNASQNSTVSSVANVNTTNVTVGFGTGGNTGMNEVTGPYSSNNAFITNTAKVGVQNDNTASVNNVVNATADTGNNRADYNTGPASVRTGSAALTSVVANGSSLFGINDNFTNVSISGAGGGGNTAGNSTTGPFSTNNAVVTNTALATINNVNDLLVNNDVTVRSRTGNNSASYNTLGGDITTGNASAAVGVGTEGNINTSGVAVAFGGFGNNASSNVTGPYSDNNAFITNTQNAVVNNRNNKCSSEDIRRLGDPAKCNFLGVFNDIDATSDAGNSNADYNTGPGSVMAGWASLIQEVLVHLNDNVNQLGL